MVIAFTPIKISRHGPIYPGFVVLILGILECGIKSR